METKEKCSEEIWSGFGHYQCSRPGKFFEDGKPWCGTHRPSAVAARRAKTDARYERLRLRMKRVSDVRDAWDAVAHACLASGLNELPKKVREAVIAYQGLAAKENP